MIFFGTGGGRSPLFAHNAHSYGGGQFVCTVSRVTMPHTMLRFPTVKARTGLSRSTIYLRISRGTFPAPVSLGGRAVGWIEAEVNAWLTARIAQRRLIAPRPERRTAAAADGYRARGRTPRPDEKGWST